jgi:aminoglycoside 6'-N-acetyltransferase
VLPTLTDGRVTLRPLAAADAAALAAIVARPGVREWWGPDGSTGLSADGFAEEARDELAFAIELGGALAGWLGFHEELDPDYRHASLDIFLAPEHQGAGHGPAALRLAAAWLIGERGHHRLTIDPARANARAIGVYESVGFRPVGVMRRYERGADGAWHDSLLMDMLADELACGR